MKKIFLFLSLLSCLVIFAQEPMTPVQIAERNKPGTVMIQATYKGTVSAIAPEIDQSGLVSLAQQVKAEVENGNLSQDQFWNVYIMTFCRDIDKYMMRGTKRLSKQLNTTMVGSGFIVTP